VTCQEVAASSFLFLRGISCCVPARTPLFCQCEDPPLLSLRGAKRRSSLTRLLRQTKKTRLAMTLFVRHCEGQRPEAIPYSHRVRKEIASQTRQQARNDQEKGEKTRLAMTEERTKRRPRMTEEKRDTTTSQGPLVRHCEGRSPEAISSLRLLRKRKDELAMTSLGDGKRDCFARRKSEARNDKEKRDYFAEETTSLR